MRILIVDEHTLVRRGLGCLVKQVRPDVKTIEAEDATAALQTMHLGRVDLVLVDVRTPDLEGLDLLRAMRAQWPAVPVIIVSNHENAPYMKGALAAGAAAYLLNDATPEDLSQAIAAAISGTGSVLSPRVMKNLLNDVDSLDEYSSNGRGEPRLTISNLTSREHDILALLAEGRSNRSIAQALFLSEKTVKTHLGAIFRKLGVTNRTQAAMMTVQLGVGPVSAVTGS